ncbi:MULTISPECIES: hypothetical protein [unclassified Paenibacillus]|uniref:hypothetical protein n=1 Tax=unclassified Paenibacillus TaxID=185978 RepID=UPI00020D6D9F|nr:MULTISPECIES: hypothetical protein [unclassified Paenibacillus]EGL16445.1 hypothetical protein HMPREF9413_0732 [Paenibacillus sp. HGF7]
MIYSMPARFQALMLFFEAVPEQHGLQIKKPLDKELQSSTAERVSSWRRVF